MSVTHLYTPKGGQGCSTVAAMLALGTDRPTVLVDAAPYPDLLGVLGVHVPNREDWDGGVLCRVNDTTQLGRDGDGLRVDVGADVYVDHGVTERGDMPGRWLMVIRPCYLALSRAARHVKRPDGIIVIEEPGRALGAADVEAVVGAEVVKVLAYDPGVARVVDSGMMAVSRPRRGVEL